MLNFDNVNDIDFEYICKDLINAKYNLNLSRGPMGKDKGIDLISNNGDSSIIGQAKFYKKTNFAGLLSSTENEVKKMLNLVETHDIKYYFYCIAQELATDKRAEINDQFSILTKKVIDKYHHDLELIILDFIEISDMLDSKEYKEIMFKHMKLWLPNTNVIKYLMSREKFIDCDLLLEDIKKEKDYYVETEDYYRCLDALEKNSCILIYGDPGSGKTTLSKMLVLRYVEKGYYIRYATDADPDVIKEQINIDESKEIILLDDFLGKTSLLLSEDKCLKIINLIKLCRIRNKKIILNTRIKIFNTAIKSFYSFKEGMKGKNEEIWIKTNNLSIDVKARIFYNHIIGNKVPSKYVSQITDKNKFLSIIKHRNYSPRIINHVCKFNDDTKNDDFYGFIIGNLDKPRVLWEDEFNKLNKYEKELLFITYSLSSFSGISAVLLNKCYDYSLKNQIFLETYNGFEDILIKMSKSFLIIYNSNYYNERMVEFLNPSVDDFLKDYLKGNSFQLDIIKNNISTFLQARNIYGNDWINKVDCNKMIDYFDSDKTIDIVYVVTKRNLLDKKYIPFFHDFFENEAVSICWWISRENNWELSLKSEEIYRFYYLDYFKGNEISYINHLYGIDWFDKIVVYSNLIKKMYSKEEYDNYILSLSHNIDVLTSRYVDRYYNEFFDSNDLIACRDSYDEDDYEDSDIDFEKLKRIINRKALEFFKEKLILIGIPREYIDCLSVEIGVDVEKNYIEAQADYYAEQAAEAAREEMYEQKCDTYDFVDDICDNLSKN